VQHLCLLLHGPGRASLHLAQEVLLLPLMMLLNQGHCAAAARCRLPLR
jgi:hypothetical protein